MENRKFIWYFFWTIVFLVLAVSNFKIGSFWGFFSWFVCVSLATFSTTQVMKTFNPKNNG